MTRYRAKKVAAPPDWRRRPRTPHTKAIEALQPGELLPLPIGILATARQKVSALRKLPGRRYRTQVVTGGNPRLEIYREA